MRPRSKELECWLEENQKEEDTVVKRYGKSGTRISGKKRTLLAAAFYLAVRRFFAWDWSFHGMHYWERAFLSVSFLVPQPKIGI